MNEKQIFGQCVYMAGLSNCDKIRFGAVAIGEGGEVLGAGCNRNPLPHNGWSCDEHCVGGLRSGVKSGTCLERCFAVHAEQAALLDALPHGRPTTVAVVGILPDGDGNFTDRLFDNGGGFYCTVCARIMAEAGVESVMIWSFGAWETVPIRTAWEQSYGVASGERSA